MRVLAPVKGYEEILEFNLHRNSPFEFEATGEPAARVNIIGAVVARPMGSWVIVQTDAASIPPSGPVNSDQK